MKAFVLVGAFVVVVACGGGSTQVGEPCTQPSECVSGATCAEVGGAIMCAKTCSSNGDCPGASACASTSQVGCCAGCACTSVKVCEPQGEI